MSGGLYRAKPKRVTDPLDDDARARIVGDRHSYAASSGSDHSGDGGDSSPHLSDLVHNFFFESDRDDPSPNNNDPESSSDRVADSVSDAAAVEEILAAGSASNADPHRNLLHAHLSLILTTLSTSKSQSQSKHIVLRIVMAALRARGHNAAVCKTKWDASGGLSAGGYEFIDVVTPGPSDERLIVDVEFRSEFEVARPTGGYCRVLEALPDVFVGRVGDLKRIVRVACDAARRSLRSRGLSIPPWRKNRYLQQKWVGPYRRTTNVVAANSGGSSAVQCRLVGFGDAGNGRVFVRTR